MTVTVVRDEARRLVDQLPDDATWEQLMDRIYVRQAIEAGLSDLEAGRIESTDDVRRRFGLIP
jgi:predicted transcriptional regulator